MATKKAPAKAKVRKVSAITSAAQKAIDANAPGKQGLAAALAVIKKLKDRAKDKPGIVKFLDAAYQEVRGGGGQDGGGADPGGPNSKDGPP